MTNHIPGIGKMGEGEVVLGHIPPGTYSRDEILEMTNHIVDANKMPPAGLWDAAAKANFETDFGECALITTPSAPPLALEAPPSFEMSGEAEAALCMEIMVLEGLQGMFEAPKGNLPDGYSSVSLSSNVWVEALLASRV